MTRLQFMKAWLCVSACVCARVCVRLCFAAGRRLSLASGNTLRWGLRKYFSLLHAAMELQNRLQQRPKM